MSEENHVQEFGRKHLENVLMLDALIGGSGFYGHPTTREIADCFAFSEQYLIDNSPTYTDSQAVKIREMADKGEDTLALRKELAGKVDAVGISEELIERAERIEDPYQRQVRVDQAKSLATDAKVILTDMGVKEYPLDYVEAVADITGTRPALIPTEDFMDAYRRETLKAMGYPEDASLAEAAAEWRERVGLLDKESMGEVYKRSAQLMLEILKRYGMPPETRLKVEILEDAPFMGFFAYGNKEGEVYGETCMVESDTKCAFDVIHTATHEIGGHFFVHGRFHDYAKRTGDAFAAVGTMATNEAVLNEGYANCAADIFRGDLPYMFENIGGFGLENMSDAELQRNLEISGMLEMLAMMSLGYEVARLFHYKNVDQEGMAKEFIEFGCDPHRAESRAKHICKGRNMLHPYCYTGPGYYPGMAVVNEALKAYGPSGIIEQLCTVKGPTSLSILKPGE